MPKANIVKAHTGRTLVKLEVVDLNCGYFKHTPVLTHVSFDLTEGTICCLLGPNGCGKTTLFKTILGIMPALSGRIYLDGEDITRWDASKLASVFAYVAQDHIPPFSYLVKDVVMLGRANKIGYLGKPTAEDLRIVKDAMMSMGVYDMRDRMYTDLSGGELQLVMIARALAQQPKVLVLDEPTAALDYGNTMRVINQIRKLASEGYAIIMTTHAPDHAFMCNSNAVLLSKTDPPITGTANEVVTERNLKQSYGVVVKIVEFVNSQKQSMRLCAPVI